MNYNKTEFKTWEQAARWLQKHGYGLEQIRIEKESWDSSVVKASEALTKPVAKNVTKTASPVAPKIK